MPNPPKKIIPNANNCASFNEIKHRQNCHLIRTGAFTSAMVHLVSRATDGWWVMRDEWWEMRWWEIDDWNWQHQHAHIDIGNWHWQHFHIGNISKGRAYSRAAEMFSDRIETCRSFSILGSWQNIPCFGTGFTGLLGFYAMYAKPPESKIL